MCILLLFDGLFCISVKLFWCNVSFKASVSLLIFCLDDLSIDVSGVLKSTAIIVLLSISPFMSVNISLYVFRCSHVGYIYIYNCYDLLLDWFLDHYVMSFFVSCNSLYFKVCFVWYKHWLSFSFPFAWNIFFHPLTFSLCVSLDLKWVSCRQHIYGSCFHIHSAILCLLIGAVSPLTFKVIIFFF